METIECPQCGAATLPSLRICEYCKAEYFVTSLAYLGNFNDGKVAKYLNHYKNLIALEPQNEEGLFGLGLCYLQIGNYQLAEKHFGKVIDVVPEQSKAYYYYALSIIKGRRIKIISFNEARKIENYLQTAIQLDDSVPEYKLLLAMLKIDFYEANGMKVPPPCSRELLSEIDGAEINVHEANRLNECARIANPEILFRNVKITND